MIDEFQKLSDGYQIQIKPILFDNYSVSERIIAGRKQLIDHRYL